MATEIPEFQWPLFACAQVQHWFHGEDLITKKKCYLRMDLKRTRPSEVYFFFCRPPFLDLLVNDADGKGSKHFLPTGGEKW